ncbi:MAG TPA: periplasmic heavy metal sensor [Rhizomicrobium sp.]|nr:periplasmic heavy metal sensor [Rhizomicrobium sp.]
MIRKTLLAAAFALAAAAPASAQGMEGHGGMGGMHSSFMMMIRSADLTPAQRSQVHLILSSNKTRTMATYRQLESLHEQIAAKLLAPGTVTAVDLKPLVDKASRLEAGLNQSKAETALAIRNVLTPAQVAKLAEVRGKLHNLHMQVQSLMGGGGQDMDN